MTSKDGEMGFPGEVAISATYLVSEDNKLVMKWSASLLGVGDTETPINLTNHAYWNLSGDFQESSIKDHTLQLNASKVLEFNDVQIPTGTFLETKETPFDFTKAEKIADRERLTGAIDGGGRPGIDHAYCVNEADPDEETRVLRNVATLTSSVSGIKMEVQSTQPAVVVYTTNWVD